MSYRISLLGSQEMILKEWFSTHPEGHERAAIVLFRRLARPVKELPESDRFIAIDIIKMTDDWILESSIKHVKFNMRKLPEIYFRCEQEGLELGFIHNHPKGYSDFSTQDDINEKNILHGLSGCNGRQSFLVSMILVENKWLARIRQGVNFDTIISVRHISILSNNLKIYGIALEEEVSEALLRQEAAFGKPFNLMLNSLRVAVVGVGGTGSPLATLLVRAGVGEMILIDGDKLEETNLNRVRGYTKDDVDKNKAESLCKYIKGLGLKVKIIAFDSHLENAATLDALSSADVVFGCTDDQDGRDLMNQALYYYAQVFIDCGLTGRIDKDEDGLPYLRDHRGRVSCILPEYGSCLRCQRVITDQWLKFEQEIKRRPELKELNAETLAREFYLTGGGEPAPGVGPFTSATADNAVATLMHLIKPFRVLPDDLRQDNIWIDFVNLVIHSNEPNDDINCIYCRERKLLLKRETKYRLDMPRFGKIN